MFKFNNVSKLNYFYQTTLHCACLSQNIVLVKYLLSLNKLDINFKDILFYILIELTTFSFNSILPKIINEIFYFLFFLKHHY